MTPRERVRAALSHTQPDFTPCDYYATPEIHERLLAHFGLGPPRRVAAAMGGSAAGLEDGGLAERLGTDIRYVNPPYVGEPPAAFDDGSSLNLWGIRRRPMPNEYGEYAEPVERPYAAWRSVEEVERFPWPSPDAFDYAAVPALCERFPEAAIATGGMWVQDFINGVAFGRGVEQVLLDIAAAEPVFLAIVERRHRFYMAYIERILAAARGRIDLVYCGDDFGTQRGLLISPAAFDALFAAKKKELFDLVHAYGAKVSHHCCGSSRQLIPRFIACGMDALQTIQPQAAGMNPYELKAAFRGRIAMHGAVDVQGWLQRATPAQIAAEVDRLMDEVGAGGGYILAPSHQIQPDTPLENVLTVYRTVQRRRA
ncbi:MAG: uroporphyrinogen decarboxylase family protein [Thermoguttaceae bacterium]|jgi:uroporphyrinogen decarboxylase